MLNDQSQQEIGIMKSSADALRFARRVLPKDEFWEFLYTFEKDIERDPEKRITKAEPIITRLFLYVINPREDTVMNKEYYEQSKAFFDALGTDIREVYLDLQEVISTHTPDQLRLMGEFVDLYRKELADREACEMQLAAIFKDIKTREGSSL